MSDNDNYHYDFNYLDHNSSPARTMLYRRIRRRFLRDCLFDADSD